MGEAEIKERKKYKHEMKKWRDEQDSLKEIQRSSPDSASKIFRHRHKQQQLIPVSNTKLKSKSKLYQYDSAFGQPHKDKFPKIGSNFDIFKADSFVEDSNRSAFCPHNSHQYQIPHCPTLEYLSADGYSWPELSLQQSLDNDPDLLPVVPKMHSTYSESTHSISFSDTLNVPTFSRYS